MSEMNNCKENLITNHQFGLILIGSMIGLGMITLPNEVSKFAKQDGWIAVILGIMYPIYLIFLGNGICKKYPDKDILDLSKMCFGKVFGTIFNITFMMFFVLIETELASGLSNVLRVYITPFLDNKKILIVMFFVPAYIAYKGIGTLARINELIFYLTLPIFLIPIAAIKDGSILNLLPVFDTSAIDILKATQNTFFAYCGIEILFFMYPFLKDKNKLKITAIKASIFTTVMYLWITFITIYYLGIDIMPKFLWPVLTVSESVKVPIINSFRYITMILNTIIIFRTMTNNYYVTCYSIKKIFKKIDKKVIVIVLYIIFFLLSLLYKNPITRRCFLINIMPVAIIINISYVTLIYIFILFKKGDENVQKK